MKKITTPQEALEFSTKAHQGQFRRPKELTKPLDTLSITALSILQRGYGKEVCELADGRRVTCDIHLNLFIAEPYINHPIAVANLLETDDEKVLAYLHDVIEDTDYKLCVYIEEYSKKDVYTIFLKGIDYQINKNIYKGLKLITKIKGDNYEDYIKAIGEDELTRKVKLADMCSNLLDQPTERQKVKYRKGIKYLLSLM